MGDTSEEDMGDEEEDEVADEEREGGGEELEDAEEDGVDNDGIKSRVRSGRRSVVSMVGRTNDDAALDGV